MDLAASVLQGTAPIAPGAPAQLAAFVAAAAGALLAVLAAAAWIRRCRRGESIAATAPAVPPPDAASDAIAVLRLFAAALLTLLALPAAAAVRQLWPHPDLGWRLAAGWAGFVLPVAAGWLAASRAAAARRPRS
jgi:hypothetical protein